MKLVILSLFFPLFLLFCFMYSNNNLSQEDKESTEQTEQTLVNQPFIVSERSKQSVTWKKKVVTLELYKRQLRTTLFHQFLTSKYQKRNFKVR
ncbi:hypothetical protein BH747_01510 [Enterococcus villorum]|uniref:Uncharacterized protein n=1 Tax=Enterococcus villorum TaxID=112904 RepID=A0A1V8YM16_9ENTE|nr:hypothetical protein BH747_01510 [Enterococcus villorum]OQO73647.1 hypothetical protein BH744_09250 [Enterococcus villorum]